MGYELRMHNEIRDWLTGLRAAEPELARLTGEAVLAMLAMLDAGESLGPPLVVSLESVLRPPGNGGDALDVPHQRQLAALPKVRRGTADVATSRKRVELQVSQLEQMAARLAGQRGVALRMGREDLANLARTREAGIQEQLSELRRQLLIRRAGGKTRPLPVGACWQRSMSCCGRFRVLRRYPKVVPGARIRMATFRRLA